MVLSEADQQQRFGAVLQPKPKTRIPMTICLDPEKHAFVERCVETANCGSMDVIIEFALSVLQKHQRARRALILRSVVEGGRYSDIMRALDDDLVLAFKHEGGTRKKKRSSRRKVKATRRKP